MRLAAGTSTDKEVRVDFPEHDRLKKVYGEVVRIDQEDKSCLFRRWSSDQV